MEKEKEKDYGKGLLVGQTKKQERVLTIDRCGDCKFCIFDDFKITERWGRHWCVLLDVHVKNEDIILKKCPLPLK